MIEMLVAITLMGIVVVTVLVAMRTTTKAAAIDRDHAIAFAWLQAASDEVYRQPRVPCDSATDPVSTYSTYAQSAARPNQWPVSSGATIAVTNVEYLGRASSSDPFEWDATYCFEGSGYLDSPLYTQRVTIEARNPSGEIVKTLQMVKNEG